MYSLTLCHGRQELCTLGSDSYTAADLHNIARVCGYACGPAMLYMSPWSCNWEQVYERRAAPAWLHILATQRTQYESADCSGAFVPVSAEIFGGLGKPATP